jgi:hypothetical protein
VCIASFVPARTDEPEDSTGANGDSFSVTSACSRKLSELSPVQESPHLRF